MRPWLGLCLLVLLGGCAHEVAFVPPPMTQSVVDQPFVLSGRLSVNMDGKGYQAGFDWQHRPAQDELIVKSPLGSTVARVVRNADGVLLEADGKQRRAADVQSLTEDTLGWPLPLEGLVWWMRGLPQTGLAWEKAEDGSLLQQGWVIRFVRDADSQQLYPKRVDMSRAGLSIKVLAQRWE